MWQDIIEKMKRCIDENCLLQVLHECYENCKDDECESICNMLYEERSRDLEF
ncbi:hypothetical protein SBRV1_gp10 [Sulfolobales Beppu rod-shaped virus 1]|uniref:Uncharacterized protein n=1 Tax=Sulfolobales Beppu rod-shaped virus 1 TaxID=2493121 RepID=A0A3S8NF30_9VIRU|nr:hypothetical protein QIT32_gp10 [Sulfolobales Beppu rod-shaped virus 1]AZI75899.1 hypothetical protein SBRV1_gp10 [Sulfolobales Beppu rod-shaped virus 1]